MQQTNRFAAKNAPQKFLCSTGSNSQELYCVEIPNGAQSNIRVRTSLPGLTQGQISQLSDYLQGSILDGSAGANPHVVQPKPVVANSSNKIRVSGPGKCPFGHTKSNMPKTQNAIPGASAENESNLEREILVGMARPLVKNPSLPTFNLSQSDFATGTYRIKVPGNYVFISDVVFDANATQAGASRFDLPVNAYWFAALSVECSGEVNIVGNGHELSQSDADMIADTPGALALVLLGNSMFSGALFSTANAIFPDSASGYVPAHNVNIVGLKFGQCNHFGIRGSNNNNVKITHCCFRDEQIGPISIQSPNGLLIDHCSFKGADQPVRVLDDESANYGLHNILGFLESLGVPGASTYLANLNVYTSANPARFVKTQILTSANYGIALVAGITPTFEFPVDTAADEASRGLAGFPGFTPAGTGVQISNCTFTDFVSDPVENVTIGTNIPRTNIATAVAAFPALFTATAPQWQDAFNSSGVFAPNDYLKALSFVMAVLYSGLPAFISGILPVNAQAIFGSILANDATTFFSNAAPLVGAGADLNYLKGLFGMRLIGMDGMTISNISMKNFDIHGARGIDPQTLPGYSLVTNPQPVVRYRGGDLWFMSLETCRNASVKHICLKNAITDFGYGFGIHLAADDAHVDVEHVSICNMKTPNAVASATTDIGDLDGISVQNNTGPITIKNVKVRRMSAAGTVHPFPESSSTVTVTNATYY